MESGECIPGQGPNHLGPGWVLEEPDRYDSLDHVGAQSGDIVDITQRAAVPAEQRRDAQVVGDPPIVADSHHVAEPGLAPRIEPCRGLERDLGPSQPQAALRIYLSDEFQPGVGSILTTHLGTRLTILQNDVAGEIKASLEQRGSHTVGVDRHTLGFEGLNFFY